MQKSDVNTNGNITKSISRKLKSGKNAITKATANDLKTTKKNITDGGADNSMKAIDFMIALGEMCKEYTSIEPCSNAKGEKCPLHSLNCDLTAGLSPEDCEKMQAIVNHWKIRNQGVYTNGKKFRDTFNIGAGEVWGLSDVNFDTWARQPYEGGKK